MTNKYWTNKKVLVTGHTGYVGKYITNELTKRDAKIIGLSNNNDKNHQFKTYKCNITNKIKLKRIITKTKPEVIIHLIAQTSVPESFENSAKTYEINYIGTNNLLESIIKSNIKPQKLLYTSSSDVYGNVQKHELPVSEKTKLRPCSPYALSKLCCEELCRYYFNNYKLPIVITRAFNHIGPNSPKRSVFNNILSQLKNNKDEESKGITLRNTNVKRDFVDVRDIIKAYLLLIEKGVDGETYNICSGKSISIRDLAIKAIKLYNINAKIISNKQKINPREIMHMQGNYDKIKEMGWYPQYTIEKSIIDSINNTKKGEND